MDIHSAKDIIIRAWDDRQILNNSFVHTAIRWVMEELDKGRLRVAEPVAEDRWEVNEWIKKAVILYFPIQQMKVTEVGPFEFHDKMELKRNYAAQGVRVVPHAIAR